MLKEKAVGGVKASLVSRAVLAVLGIIQLAVLTRAFGPDDFGEVALLTLLLGFTTIFLDAGISNAIICAPDLTRERLSTLYWINVLAGLLVFLLVNLLIPRYAAFFGHPGSTGLLRGISLVLLVQPFGQQFGVLLQKELRFTRLAAIEIISALTGFLLLVCLAIKGWGAAAVVTATLATAVLTCILQALAVGAAYRPQLVFHPELVLPQIRFGLFQLGEKVMNYFVRNLDQLIVGRYCGLETLGFYSLALRIVYLPIQWIHPLFNRVAFPVLARLQDDPPRFHHYYARGLRILMTVTLPILLGLFCIAPDLIPLYFGEGWQEVVPLTRVLVLAGVVHAFGNPGGAVLLARGRADVIFAWLCAFSLNQALMFWWFLAAEPTAQMAAQTRLLVWLETMVFWHAIVAFFGRVSYGRVVQDALRIVGMGFVMVAVLQGIHRGLEFWTPFSRLGLMIPLGVLVYGIQLILLDRESFRFILRAGREGERDD